MMDSIEVVIYILGVLAYLWNERRKVKKTQTTPAILLATYKKSAQVYAILSDLRDLSKCDRACVLQFQNGGKWHSGESIQRMSITHESKYYTLRSLKSKYQDVLISADDHPYFGDLLKFKIYSVNDVNTLPEGSYKTKLLSKKVTSAYYFLLEDNKSGRPLGMIVLTYSIRNGLQTGVSVLEAKENARQIAAILVE